MRRLGNLVLHPFLRELDVPVAHEGRLGGGHVQMHRVCAGNKLGNLVPCQFPEGSARSLKVQDGLLRTRRGPHASCPMIASSDLRCRRWSRHGRHNSEGAPTLWHFLKGAPQAGHDCAGVFLDLWFCCY